MPKVHSYSVVHYGRDYLPYALRSVQDFVEQSHIFYTPHPSHGHQVPNIPPVESEQEITDSISGIKCVWTKVDQFYNEGPHRDFAVQVCTWAKADLILVLDYDEIWPEDMLRKAIDYVWTQNSKRNWLVNMTHMWKSFGYACKDNNWPVRIIDLRHESGDGFIPIEFGDVYHFGYAIKHETMSYKWCVHGHKYELKPGWFQDKWEQWPPATDVHPTNGDNWWMPEAFDKTKLPLLMRDHPWYNLDVIK